MMPYQPILKRFRPRSPERFFGRVARNAAASGFSLVEILLTVALMGTVMMAITNMMVKGAAQSGSMETRYQEAIEVQAVVQDMMQDLAQGAYISNNSHKYRLEYTTYNTSGTATKKVYGICYAPATVAGTDTTCSVSSGTNNTAFLKLSLDGGSTWGSPYRASGFNDYYLTGTPTFVYAQEGNNCTLFTDTDANGVWLSGTDAAGAATNCSSVRTTNPVLPYPSFASKVILAGFSFAAKGGTTGSYSVPRALPSYVFMSAPQGPLVSYSAAVSPGVKDSPLLHSFDNNTANSLFGSGFWAYALNWDPVRQRLLVTGGYPAKILQVDRSGVLIGPPLPLYNGGLPDGIVLMEDGVTAIVLDAFGKVNWYNLKDTLPLVPTRILTLSDSRNGTPALAGSTNLVNSPYGLSYDPKYPNEIFVLGYDPADSNPKIFEIDITTGAYATNVLSGGKLALPAAFDATHLAFGLSQEPTTGDFLVTRDYVNGSSPNKTIDIYRITSSGSYSYFSVNIDDLGSTATTTAGGFGAAYDPVTNHLFLSDVSTGKIYEVYPDRLISPRY